VVIVAAAMTLIPVEQQLFEYPSVFHILIIGLTIGWLSEIWNNRKRIKRRMALLVFLGYAVWVTVSEANMRFSDTFCRWESVVMICAVLFAALLSRGCHESDT
jgi:cation transport ATPase